MKKFRRASFVILAFLAPPAPAFADVIFSDSTFDPSTYSAPYVYVTVPPYRTDVIDYSICATCGNPGSAVDIRATEPYGDTTSEPFGGGPSFSLIGIVNSAFSYNPLTQGPIATISASVDENITGNAVGPLENYFRPLIEQDGKFYAAAIAGPALTSPGTTGYVTMSAAGLTAADFLEIDPNFGFF